MIYKSQTRIPFTMKTNQMLKQKSWTVDDVIFKACPMIVALFLDEVFPVWWTSTQRFNLWNAFNTQSFYRPAAIQPN